MRAASADHIPHSTCSLSRGVLKPRVPRISLDPSLPSAKCGERLNRSKSAPRERSQANARPATLSDARSRECWKSWNCGDCRRSNRAEAHANKHGAEAEGVGHAASCCAPRATGSRRELPGTGRALGAKRDSGAARSAALLVAQVQLLAARPRHIHASGLFLLLFFDMH